MTTTRFHVSIFVVGLMVLRLGAVSAQDYPGKPIRIVTSAPGGGTDFTARLVAHGLSGAMGQPVIVDNRVNIGAFEIVMRAPPDGYTLLVAAGQLWIGSLLRKTSYDAIRDFLPITLATTTPNLLIGHPSLAKSVKELIALAKARPGQINYGSGASGASSHLAAELFKSMADVNIVRIPYKGSGPALNAVLTNEVQLMFPNAAIAIPHVKSGRLKALGLTSLMPSAVLPGVPTIAGSGLPGYEAVSIDGVFAPAKTPAAIVNRLNGEIVRYINQAEVKARILSTGADAVGSSPAEFSQKIRSEVARLGKVIKDAGIRIEE